jgi:hypothetical protein
MYKTFNKIRSFSLQKILILLGVGSMAFILEACYGVPSDEFVDEIQPRSFELKSDSSFLEKRTFENENLNTTNF